MILALNKSEERGEKSGFVHTAVFLREREIFSKRANKLNFFVHVRHLKAVFLQLLMVLRIDYDMY